VEREATGTVDWILDLPNKLALEQDPVLRAAEAGERNLDTFEALCLLYVAMTRDRMGLYCLSNTPGRNSSQLTWHQLFENVLGSDGVPDEAGLIAWQRSWGPPDWHLHVHNPPREPVPPVRIEPLAGPLPPVRPNLRRAASPSQESHAEESVVRRLRSNAGRRFGSRMHEVLATIGWLPDFDEATLDRVVSAAPEDLQERIRRLLHSPLGQEVFAKPNQPVDLWREKPYILRRQQTVANGIIDRAHLFLDAAGNPAKAVIYDFKTDVLDPERSAEEQLLERYAVQLDRYREALCLLTGLRGEAVSVRLVPV
jgi:ATP-dependent helicase/nuclease subunit A